MNSNGRTFLFLAKQFKSHYLLSGDSDGAIHLWELSLLDQKVIFFSKVSLD